MLRPGRLLSHAVSHSHPVNISVHTDARAFIKQYSSYFVYHTYTHIRSNIRITYSRYAETEAQKRKKIEMEFMDVADAKPYSYEDIYRNTKFHPSITN